MLCLIEKLIRKAERCVRVSVLCSIELDLGNASTTVAHVERAIPEFGAL